MFATRAKGRRLYNRLARGCYLQIHDDVPLAAAKRPILAGLNRGINDGSSFCGAQGCLRCLLLVICTHPFAKEALTLHLARSEGRERYFGSNLMQRKVLRHLTNT